MISHLFIAKGKERDLKVQNRQMNKRACETRLQIEN